MKTTDSVAIVSGGLDSTTLVYEMLEKGYTPHILSFNYGQRHKKELNYARATARQLDLPHDIIDLSGLTHLISNSALTSPAGRNIVTESEIEVPEGHYAADNMKATVVPNRNMIMLAIAAGIGINEKARTIGIGVHAGDHFIYPDCRPKFIHAMIEAIGIGNEGFDSFDWSLFGTARQKPRGWNEDVENMLSQVPADEFGTGNTGGPIFAPFLHSSKADIAYRALELGVAFHLTWSCYKGDDKHCGKCGTCVERLEAIDEALTKYKDVTGIGTKGDYTDYEDNEFWKTQVRADQS